MPFVEQDALRNARAKLDNSAISDRLDELTESPALRQFLEFSLQSLKAAQVALARASVARDNDDKETKTTRIEFVDAVAEALACYSDVRDEIRAAVSDARLRRKGREASVIDQAELDRRNAQFNEGFQWAPSTLAKKASHMILEILVKANTVLDDEPAFKMYNSIPEFSDLVAKAVARHEALNNEIVDDRLAVKNLNEARENFDRVSRAHRSAVECVLLFENKVEDLNLYIFAPRKSQAIEPDTDAESLIANAEAG